MCAAFRKDGDDSKMIMLVEVDEVELAWVRSFADPVLARGMEVKRNEFVGATVDD